MGNTQQHLLLFQGIIIDMKGNTKNGLKINPTGDRKNYPIDKVNFLPLVPLNQVDQPRPYLIIGFDTEYQTRDELRKGKIYLDNDVLSYQYSCSIINHLNEGNEETWEGIVLPDSYEIKDRISFQTFIEFIIGHGISNNPKIRIPRDIYLVSHFTRCDVPGFSDFSEDKDRSTLNFQNVRGSFVNVKQDLLKSLNDSESNEDIKVRIKVRDTLHISPQQGGSLEKLGMVLGYEKVKLGKDSTEEKDIKSNMKQFHDDHWDLFKKYGIRDSEICNKWVNKLIRLNYKVHDDQSKQFKLPITLSSIGVSLLEDHWKQNGLVRLDIMGKEILKETYYSKTLGRKITNNKEEFIPRLFHRQDFLTDSYHGGRNEQYWFGQSHKDTWTDFDLSGCYPTIMSLIGKPDWDSMRILKDTKDMLDSKPVDLTFCYVKFEFPKSVRYPTLPVRTDEGIVFPRTGESITHISEILLSKKLGCKLELIEGWTWESERFKDPNNRIFREFLKECTENRNRYDKKTVENLFWKEISNSIYGKTGQGLRRRRIYDLKLDRSKDLKPSKITNPIYSSFITSFSRGILGEIMNNLPSHVNVFSVTTDGFLTNSTQKEMDDSIDGILCKYFKDGRYKLTDDDTIIETKHKVRQLLGWRTRGQSTLQPSIDSDWDSDPKDDEKIVLAKSGIKLPDVLGKEEENDEIIRLFFQRKPTDVIPMTLGLGIKDLYRGGYDFVHKEMKKRLSMEFDWKRKPFFVGQSHVKFKSTIDQNHLFFSTKPWESVKDFLKIRELWEQYNNPDHHCLKTMEDYDDFRIYVESNLSLSESNKKYLKRKDGDLVRLRQNLIVANRHRRSGTTNNYPHKPPPNQHNNYSLTPKYIFKDKKLTSKELTYLLNDVVDLPCKKSDVDNGRRKQLFEKHSTPNTKRVREMLDDIKRLVFPDLVIEDFLPTKSELNLDSVQYKDCELSQRMDCVE